MNRKFNSPVEKAALDFAYILMVKSATYPVYINTNNTQMEPDGSLLFRGLNIETLESGNIYHSMMHYECLGKLDFFNIGEALTEKAQKKMVQLCQKRSCLPHSFTFVELMAQIDVFSSIEENTAKDEVEFVKHNLEINFSECFQTDECRFIAYNTSYDRELTSGYKMVEEGFQRLAFDLTLLIGVAKD